MVLINMLSRNEKWVDRINAMDPGFFPTSAERQCPKVSLLSIYVTAKVAAVLLVYSTCPYPIASYTFSGRDIPRECR